MEKVLSTLWISAFCLIVFPIVTVIDIIMVLIMAINKALRTIWFVISGIVMDDEEKMTVRNMTGEIVNDGYTTLVDWMYPVD